VGNIWFAKVTRLKGEIMPLKKLKLPLEIDESEEYVPKHWALITNCSKTVCSICDKKAKGASTLNYWGKHRVTKEGMYRHKHCVAGSANWIKKFNGWVTKDLNLILGKTIINEVEEKNETTETQKEAKPRRKKTNSDMGRRKRLPKNKRRSKE
jgi:hypothetical protein